jgi:hypothetical protein
VAGSKSDYLENALLNQVLGAAAFTAPGTVYVALYTAALTDASTGTSAAASEVSTSGTAYARVAVTNNTTNWPTTSTGSKSNANAINFPTATGSWGTVTHFAVLDSATVGAGNILYWASLTSSKTIGNGDTASFAASQITITED